MNSSYHFNNKLSLIADLGQQIGRIKRLDNLNEILIKHMKVILDAEHCSLLMVDKHQPESWTCVLHEKEKKVVHFPIDQGVAGLVARTGKMANIIDAYNDPHFHEDFDIKTGYKTKSILAMAMRNNLGKVLGVFQALNKNSGYFTSEDESLLNILVSMAIVAIENVHLLEEIRHSQYETIKRLALVTQLRDPTDLSGHLSRISEYSKLISLEMGLSIEKAEIISFASMLHDVGKVGVPDNILLLKRRLTPEEYEAVKLHTIYGAQVLDHPTNELLKAARDIAIAHHENYDGTGYPFGLKNEEIPLEARIVTVADVFDALMSRRVYKDSWGLSATVAYMKTHSGKKFDPSVVQALLNCLPFINKMLEKQVNTTSLPNGRNHTNHCA